MKGWLIYGARTQNNTPEVFLFTWQLLLSNILYLLPDQRLYIVKNTCVYTHICIVIAYELPLLANNTAVKHFYTNI